MADVHKVVSRVLGIPLESVTGSMARETTSEWDSFNHLMLISEIEKEFRVQIPMSEIENIKSIADIERMVTKS